MHYARRNRRRGFRGRRTRFGRRGRYSRRRKSIKNRFYGRRIGRRM